jgi:hypothetical protein
MGQNFDSKAIILENGTPQTTLPGTPDPTKTLIGKKLYKKLSPGQIVTIQVMDFSGLLSNQVSYQRPQ